MFPKFIKNNKVSNDNHGKANEASIRALLEFRVRPIRRAHTPATSATSG